MPYISASIILQLLGTVYKPLEELKKEGEAGQKRLTEYTRYLTVVLCLIQSTGYLWFIMGSSGDGPSMVAPDFCNANGNLTFFWGLTSVLIMTCGSVFLMWLGEQIDEYGIGNGISLLIMAGIVAQMPPALNGFLGNASLSLCWRRCLLPLWSVLCLSHWLSDVFQRKVLNTYAVEKCTVELASTCR